MICFPNCKINLGLYVTSRRSDGYHNLETVFWPVDNTAVLLPYAGNHAQATTALNDVLEIVPATTGKTQLISSGLAVAGNATDNLIWKAYELLQQATGGALPPLDIYLHKAMPMGAGLGGGSADGAYMLQLLNDYCQLGYTQQALASFALQLGSDCPFFIYNSPQVAFGRGEQLQPIQLDLSAYQLKIVCPGIHVSTRDAFANISPGPASFHLAQLGTLAVEQWKDLVRNDFEQTVFAAHPAIAAIKADMYASGATYASMTGTGSAVYGLFKV